MSMKIPQEFETFSGLRGFFKRESTIFVKSKPRMVDFLELCSVEGARLNKGLGIICADGAKNKRSGST